MSELEASARESDVVYGPGMYRGLDFRARSIRSTLCFVGDGDGGIGILGYRRIMSMVPAGPVQKEAHMAKGQNQRKEKKKPKQEKKDKK